jgi:hypothetical protein
VGGKCVVAWVNAACPKQYGDLGIPNLRLLGFALRLHWLRLDMVDSDKTWPGYFFRVDQSSQAFFDVSVTVQVGDGSRALFLGMAMGQIWIGCSVSAHKPITQT